jgi:hypothetical protein
VSESAAPSTSPEWFSAVSGGNRSASTPDIGAGHDARLAGPE